MFMPHNGLETEFREIDCQPNLSRDSAVGALLLFNDYDPPIVELYLFVPSHEWTEVKAGAKDYQTSRYCCHQLNYFSWHDV